MAMTTPPKIVAAWQAVVNATEVPGDIVEAGVYRGGLSMVMAWAEMVAVHGARHPHPRRTLWLYDTFEGLPPPTAEDDNIARLRWANAAKVSGAAARDAFRHGSEHIDENGVIRWNYGPLDEVRRNMNATGYPMHRVRFVKGRLEDTLKEPDTLPGRIAVLRLDTDWFESTRAALDALFPRLSPGGYLFIDDYCKWRGQRAATDAWLRQHRSQLQADSIKGHGTSLCFMARRRFDADARR